MRLIVHVEISLLTGEGQLVDLVLMNEFLKAAIPGRVASGTLKGMGPQQQHELLGATCLNFRGMCGHLHPIRYNGGTRGQGESPLFYGDLHHTQTTAPIRLQTLVEAQSWNTDCFLGSGFQYGNSGLDTDFGLVDRYCDHRCSLAWKVSNDS